MTGEDLATRVLAELGHVRADIGGIRDDLTKLGRAVVKLEAYQGVNHRRLGVLEAWREDAADEATTTGQHELARLRGELGSIRARRLDVAAKSGLLVLGAVVASAVPALLRALGLGG